MTVQQMRYRPKDEEALMTELWDPAIADNPYAAIMFAFPWGKAGTPLEHFTGPRTWQCEDLQELAEQIKTNKQRMADNLPPIMFRKATVSGRGPGKSALVAWLTWWFRTCILGSTCIVTANTEAQLKTRTFAEITKWNTLAINGHWFETSVLSVKPAAWFEELLKRQLQIDTGYYYVQGQLWSEENPDAFAGAHNEKGEMALFDEASGIPRPIWTVQQGVFTEPTVDRYWLAFSNPRRNEARLLRVLPQAPRRVAAIPDRRAHGGGPADLTHSTRSSRRTAPTATTPALRCTGNSPISAPTSSSARTRWPRPRSARSSRTRARLS
jgi:hypothetical protein